VPCILGLDQGGYPAFLEFIEQKEEEQANALIKGGKLVLRKAVSDGKKERALVLVVSPASNLTNGLTSEIPIVEAPSRSASVRLPAQRRVWAGVLALLVSPFTVLPASSLVQHVRLQPLGQQAALIQAEAAQRLTNQAGYLPKQWANINRYKVNESTRLNTAAAKKYRDCTTKYAGKGIPGTLEACLMIAQEQGEKAAQRLKELVQALGARYRRSNAYNVKGIQQTAATALKETNQAKQAVEGQHRKFNNAYSNLFRRMVGLPPLS
jgi:hypothetical protein